MEKYTLFSGECQQPFRYCVRKTYAGRVYFFELQYLIQLPACRSKNETFHLPAEVAPQAGPYKAFRRCRFGRQAPG